MSLSIPDTAADLLAELAAAPDAPEPAQPSAASWPDFDAPARDANEALAEYCRGDAPAVPLTVAAQAAIIAGLARALAERQIAAAQAQRAAQDRALLRVLLARDVTPPAPVRTCPRWKGYEWWKGWLA